MNSLDEIPPTSNPREVQRIQTLVIGRLLVIFLMLVASWYWHSGTLKASLDSIPQGLFIVFIISVGLTIAYFFVLRLSRAYIAQLTIQFLLDSLLITWLIWRTGDLTSPYITLYIVLIGVAGFFLRPLPTLFLAVWCSFCFVVLSSLTAAEVIESSGTVQAIGKAIQIVSFQVVALLVVGLLASRLSERRSSGEELAETAKTLASLRALHERIVESIRSGLVTTDLDGVIYTFNAAATEITGYRLDQVQGRPISDLFGDIQEQIDLSLAAAGEGEQLPRFETDLITPEGFAVRIGFSVSLLFSKENEASGLIITFQDLTDIRSMEESIRRKDRLAAVGRIAAGLAHEIRNPLGAMKGAIQMLGSRTISETSRDSLMEIVLKESDRLNKIITNFLNYARPAAADFADVDLAELIRETVSLIKHGPDVLESHDISAELPSSPVVVSADAAQLKQIFWNLSRNALQAMPDGGKLAFGLETQPNQRVRIKIADTGRGMSQDQVEKLFEPFSESTTGGTGLGLSIVYQIVKDHNGAINVRSKQGSGTTITIDLPTGRRTPKEQESSGKIVDFLNVRAAKEIEKP
jgi:two-component system sensor histidine kinase PilS (NtrC family)